MSKRKALAAGLVGTLLAVALVVYRTPDGLERELTLAWAMNIDGQIEASRIKAQTAVGGLGTNAIPILLNWIQADPSRSSWPRRFAQRGVKRFNSLYGGFIQRWAFDHYRRDRAEAAVWGLQLLGAGGNPAIPGLKEIAATNSPLVRQRAHTAIKAIQLAQ